MARAAVIGETSRVQGYALAGAVVYLAEDEAAVRTAWQALPADVEVVIVTARAGHLQGQLSQPVPQACVTGLVFQARNGRPDPVLGFGLGTQLGSEHDRAGLAAAAAQLGTRERCGLRSPLFPRLADFAGGIAAGLSDQRISSIAGPGQELPSFG